MPSASERPWTAYGVYASAPRNPCSRMVAAACSSVSGLSYSASTPRIGLGLAKGLYMAVPRVRGHAGRLLGTPEHRLHLGDRDRREEAAEEEEPHEEEPERTDDDRIVEDRGLVVGPVHRKEVPVQRAHDDREPFEPHSHVDQERDHEHDRQTPAEALEPEELRRDHVAGHHDPVGPGERPGGA